MTIRDETTVSPWAGIPKGVWLLRAVIVFCALSTLLTLAGWPIARGYIAGRIDVIDARERGLAATATLDIETALHEILADLRVAARLPSLQQYLNAPTPEHEQTFSSALKNVMEAYQRYSRIRLLDAAGNEVVRVDERDGAAFLVPHERLQNKTDRYYFQAALALPAGESYVSPIERNIENGNVEAPYRPTLRVATPVHDAAGGKRGVLVLDVRGDDVLARFRDIMKTEPLHEPMLLDTDGNWLSNGSGGKQGGLPAGKDSAGFVQAFPAEWQTIAAGDRGLLRSDAGLFAYATVHLPPTSIADAPAAAPAAGRQPVPYLKIVLRVPPESLRNLLFPSLPLTRAVLSVAYAATFVFSALLAYVSLYRRRAREIERAAAREIEDLYDRAPCGYHSLDRNGRVIRMNQTELEWLGYDRDEIVGKRHISDLLPPDSRRTFEELFPQFMATGHIADVEVELRRKDGSLLPVSVSASAVRDAAGAFVMSRSSVFDATERRRLERELLRQASTDALTGVGNRRHFFELAGHELARSRRTGAPLSLLLIDIDNFKGINDRWGHELGDTVLKTMAAACTAELRGSDVFARLGGEEFCALLPATDAAEAQQIAERVRQALGRLRVRDAQQREVQFTVSIGLAALATVSPNDDIQHMLRRADAALYRAKAAGRDSVRAAN